MDMGTIIVILFYGGAFALIIGFLIKERKNRNFVNNLKVGDVVSNESGSIKGEIIEINHQ